jgi:hypothetical protein
VTVTIDQMRDKMIPLDGLRERLAETEPLPEQKIVTGGGDSSPVSFRVDPDWDTQAALADDTALVPAYMRLDDRDYQLTKQGLLDAGAFIGIPRGLQQRTPHHLMESQLNWWFRTGFGETSFRALLSEPPNDDNAPYVTAMSRAKTAPFSNLRILDTVLEKVHERFGDGAEVLADYKLTHGLPLTHVRLIMPGQQRVITGPSTVPDDVWSTGVQWQNSLLGLRPTALHGYVFRWVCTNGQTDTMVTSGQWNRRSDGADEEGMYEWASQAVDEIFTGLEHTLDGVQATTEIPVEREVNLVLRDLFAQHTVPVREQQRVISELAETGGDWTMYAVMNAVTSVANTEGLAPAAVKKLLEVGGHIAHASEQRCGECHRIKP